MLFLGTTHGSNTSEEMAKALGVVVNRNVLKLGYHNIVKTYTNEQNFLYGNNFWVQNGFPLNKTFAKLVSDNMNSDVTSLDFSEADSVRQVNSWVSNMTGGKIDNLVDSFSPDTTPFIEQKSSQIGYQRINNTKLDLEVITIPYKNPLFEMQIILPKDVRGMKHLEGAMQLSNTQDLNPSQTSFFNLFAEKNRVESVDFIEDVFLKMPTFKIKTDMDAAEALQKLGVHRVFSQNAELEGISNAPISVG